MIYPETFGSGALMDSLLHLFILVSYSLENEILFHELYLSSCCPFSSWALVPHGIQLNHFLAIWALHWETQIGPKGHPSFVHGNQWRKLASHTHVLGLGLGFGSGRVKMKIIFWPRNFWNKNFLAKRLFQLFCLIFKNLNWLHFKLKLKKIGLKIGNCHFKLKGIF